MNFPTGCLLSYFAVMMLGVSPTQGEPPTARPVSSLRAELSPEDFARAGLEKLNPEELAYLESLVAAKGRTGGANTTADVPADAPRGEAAFGKDAEIQATAAVILKVPNEIRSRIKGPFSGWSGKTTFVLENGQTWRQTEGGSFYLSAESPMVEIKRGALGTYFLRVDGYNSRTKVARVK